MKTFMITDFYLQSLLTLLLLLFIVSSSTRDLAIVVYFLIAVNHFISVHCKMFSGAYKKSILFIVYYIISMLFIIILLSLAASDEIYLIDRFWHMYGRYVMDFAMGGTPILAFIYYLIYLNDYRRELKK